MVVKYDMAATQQIWKKVIVFFAAVAIGIVTCSTESRSALNGVVREDIQEQSSYKDVVLPFSPGEKLNFILKWGSIPAGKASLEVKPASRVNGELAYHFVMTARTNSFVDVFYKVRDKIEGFTSLDMSRSLRYKKKQREGRYKRNVLVEFDWNAAKTRQTRVDKGREYPWIDIPPGTFDPLSALYFTRLADFQEGMNIERPVTDGRKTVTGIVKVMKKETLTIDGTRYETYKLQPSTQGIGGVFKESDDAKLFVWITADKRRIPVKVKSKVLVGSFIGELSSMESGNPDATLSGRAEPE